MFVGGMCVLVSFFDGLVCMVVVRCACSVVGLWGVWVQSLVGCRFVVISCVYSGPGGCVSGLYGFGVLYN